MGVNRYAVWTNLEPSMNDERSPFVRDNTADGSARGSTTEYNSFFAGLDTRDPFLRLHIHVAGY